MGFLGLIKLIVGYEKDRNRFKKDALMSIVIYTMLYYMFIYLAGIFTGFLKSPYGLDLILIIRNLFPVVFLIFSSEFLRYAINRKGTGNNIIIVFSTLIFVLVDISILLFAYDLSLVNDMIELIALVIIPSISKNAMMSYSSVKYGKSPNILYACIMQLPIYLIPIMPDFGNYIDAIINFIFPVVVFVLLYILYNKLSKKKEKVNSRNRNLIDKSSTVLTVIIILVVVYLTSGLFRFFALSIGSGSMSSVIEKGDVVIVEKYKEDQLSKLVKGDILVFEINDVVVVHRIEEIIFINNSYSFKTKGDNNEVVDNWIVTSEQVIGKVNFKIKYIGYPTVWINEMIK